MNRIMLDKPNLSNLRAYQCVDMHIHTIYSDGIIKINDLQKISKKQNLGFAITDHMTIKGAVKAFNNYNFIIPGIEVSSKDGKDVLFYFYSPDELSEFYEKEIKYYRHKIFPNRTTFSLLEVIQLGRDYNCVSSLAHPCGFLWKQTYSELVKKKSIFKKNIQAIEVINAGLPDASNIKAIDFLSKNDFSFTGGSDSHSTPTLGSVITCSRADSIEDFLDNIKKKKNFVIGKRPGNYNYFHITTKIKRLLEKFK